MLFKILAITFSFVVHCALIQAEDRIQAKSTIVKEDLGDLYAVAFNNKWKTVTERIENIVINYEKTNDFEETLKQLATLKEFVLTSKLNPVRTDAFLESYETLVDHINNISEAKIAPPAIVVVEAKPAAIVSPKTEKPWFENWMGGALAGVVGGSLFLLYRYKNKKSVTPNDPQLDFEQYLERESDLNCWANIRPEIYRLIFQSRALMKESAASFVMEDLFSLEFKLLGQTLPAESIARLKKIVSQHQGELLLVSDYKAEGIIQTRKLVLNFPLDH